MSKSMRNKGITLIALVITIIVLLILAGVAIASLSGDNSAPQKAREAKMASERTDEEDAIKMAVVEAVSRGNDAQVSDENLRATLEGVAKSITTNEDGTWTVVGKLGKVYEITGNATVNELSGLVLTPKKLTLKIENDTYEEKTVTARLIDIEGTLTWTSNSNIIDITPSSDGMTANIKAVESGVAQITVECTSGDVANCNVTVEEKIKPKAGDYIDLGKNLVGNTSTEDDWKILYNGTGSNDSEVGGKIYCILADYLPNEKRIECGIETEFLTVGAYCVRTGNFDTLVEKLTSDWSALVSENVSNIDDVRVIGALDLSTHQKMKSQNGNKYYIPQSANYNGCYGYWLSNMVYGFSGCIGYTTGEFGVAGNGEMRLSRFL